MKKSLILSLSLLFFVGCANMYVKSDMLKTINENATVATKNVATMQNETLTNSQYLDIIVSNEKMFVAYADAKTVNFFSYLFGKYTILVDGEYATRLDKAKVLAINTSKRATTQPTAWLKQIIVKESKVINDVADAANGRKGTP